MKVVINSCYGGFSLSDKAMQLYCDKKGIKVYPEHETCGSTLFYLKSPEERKESNEEDDNIIWSSDIKRNDSTLVEVVKELGRKANGTYAKLKIVNIPDDISWEVDEYSGMESIEELHRSWS